MSNNSNSGAFEQHQPGNWLRDVILGGQDGLVNVLGIILGVTAANGHVQIIIAASLAAAFAEGVSMGAVAYTSANAEKDHYQKELEREKNEIEHFPEKEKEEVRQIYLAKGFSGKMLDEVVKTITSNKEIWVNTMMGDELGLKQLDSSALFKSSIIVAAAAIIGGIIPTIPFFILSQSLATPLSIIIGAIVLFGVGFYEATTFVGNPIKEGIKMVLIGMGAAIVGFIVGKFFHVN